MSDSPPIDIMSDSLEGELVDEPIDYDVVVVGAGISGLTAATEIAKRAPDLKVTFLICFDSDSKGR